MAVAGAYYYPPANSFLLSPSKQKVPISQIREMEEQKKFGKFCGIGGLALLAISGLTFLANEEKQTIYEIELRERGYPVLGSLYGGM